MNNRGFTLIELLVGLAIIGVFSLVLVHLVKNTFSTAVMELDQVSDNSIFEAAKSYALEKDAFEEDNSICVSMQQLIDYGYLDNNVSDSVRQKIIKVTRNIRTKVIEEIKYVLVCN